METLWQDIRYGVRMLLKSPSSVRGQQRGTASYPNYGSFRTRTCPLHGGHKCPI